MFPTERTLSNLKLSMANDWLKRVRWSRRSASSHTVFSLSLARSFVRSLARPPLSVCIFFIFSLLHFFHLPPSPLSRFVGSPDAQTIYHSYLLSKVGLLHFWSDRTDLISLVWGFLNALEAGTGSSERERERQQLYRGSRQCSQTAMDARWHCSSSQVDFISHGPSPSSHHRMQRLWCCLIHAAKKACTICLQRSALRASEREGEWGDLGGGWVTRRKESCNALWACVKSAVRLRCPGVFRRVCGSTHCIQIVGFILIMPLDILLDAPIVSNRPLTLSFVWSFLFAFQSPLLIQRVLQWSFTQWDLGWTSVCRVKSTFVCSVCGQCVWSDVFMPTWIPHGSCL